MSRLIRLIASAILLGLFVNSCKSDDSKSSQPNFVILFADDMGYGDLSVFGNPVIKTPNLDRMAAEGMKFTNFYSGSPACTASRYALLTGRYPARSGFSWVLVPNSKRGLHPQEITIAEALKEKGYQCAVFGKWHLGTTRKEYLPLQQGFDEYLGLPYSNDMIPPKWPDIPLIDGNDTVEINPDQDFLTRRYTERAVAFIRSNHDHPFFLYLPYAMPHVPLHPGPEFRGSSQRGIFGDVVEEIDWSAGQIMKVLKEEKLEKNTLLVFTSDNGPWIIKQTLGGSSGLFRDGKGSTWEGGMHEPAIAWWPESIKGGSLCLEPSSTLDLFPTLISLAGMTIPDDRPIDGRDISAHLLDQTAVETTPYFYYGPSNLHAVRLGPWKLHIYTSSQTGVDYFNSKLPLLFNLDEDPSEKYDLSDERPDKVSELLELIRIHEENRLAHPGFWESNPLN